MKKKIMLMLLLSIVALAGVPEALAFPGYLNTFNATYPDAVGTRIDTCALCHINPAGGGTRNPYGMDFGNQTTRTSQAFRNIEGNDSDNDTFSNIAEINATPPTFPGNASDFPVLPPVTENGSISGMKFHDSNNNSMKDANESGLANWTIILTNQTGSSVTINTDNSGNYTFGGLAAGNYVVEEVLKPNWRQTFPPEGNYTVNLSSGQNVTDRGFGNVLNVTPTPTPTPGNGSISGMKFNDSNNNSVRDANESGLENWTINLTDQNGSTVTTTTDANGNYTFGGLAAGNYTVEEVVQIGWRQTFPTNRTYNITITDAENITGIDFGNNLTIPPGGSISGMKFHDLNNNSAKDAGELGLSNWTIILTRPDGTTDSTMTDANGNYTFSNLPPGNYTVSEVVKTNWTQTFPANGTYNVTITDAENVTDIDFGNNLTVTPPTGVIAVRIIEKESIRLGESTNVTVNISSDINQALSLQEIIPAGWNLTRISDDADAFKNSTNEWVWFNMTPGVNRTVVYRLTPPSNATIGTYHINGTVSNSSGVITDVTGDDDITLDITVYYRRLGSDPDRVETSDVLTAIEDWRNQRAPAGFERAITTQELLALIDEWLRS